MSGLRHVFIEKTPTAVSISTPPTGWRSDVNDFRIVEWARDDCGPYVLWAEVEVAVTEPEEIEIRTCNRDELIALVGLRDVEREEDEEAEKEDWE